MESENKKCSCCNTQVVQKHYRRCPGCNVIVCDDCFDRPALLCKRCVAAGNIRCRNCGVVECSLEILECLWCRKGFCKYCTKYNKSFCSVACQSTYDWHQRQRMRCLNFPWWYSHIKHKHIQYFKLTTGDKRFSAIRPGFGSPWG